MGWGLSWVIPKKASCTAKPAEKKILQWEPMRKHRATAIYYPAPVFAQAIAHQKNIFLEILEIFRVDIDQISSNLLKKAFRNMTACLPFHKHRVLRGVLRHFCSSMRRLIDFFKFLFLFFFAFHFPPFLSFCCSD